MTTLYKKIDGVLHYWETWENADANEAYVHYGKVGEEGITETFDTSESAEYVNQIQKMMDNLDGYGEIADDDFQILLIEYPVDGFGTKEDLQKRHALQDRMQEVTGWNGLGFCDGGSIGSGSMEVCCFVVDFETAKKVIAEDLKNTEYGDYSRIYLED